jgi:hypothetical protein
MGNVPTTGNSSAAKLNASPFSTTVKKHYSMTSSAVSEDVILEHVSNLRADRLKLAHLLIL